MDSVVLEFFNKQQMIKTTIKKIVEKFQQKKDIKKTETQINLCDVMLPNNLYKYDGFSNRKDYLINFVNQKEASDENCRNCTKILKIKKYIETL